MTNKGGRDQHDIKATDKGYKILLLPTMVKEVTNEITIISI